MSKKREIFARVGIASKGLVYILIGCLTGFAAFGWRKETAGKSEVFKTISNQPFGRLLLIIIAIGLICYVFWMLYQVFTNHNDIKYIVRSIAMKTSYFISAIFYGFLAFVALKIALKINSDSSNQEVLKMILEKPFGQVMVFIVATIILGNAVFQVGKVITGQYKKDLDNFDLKEAVRQKLLYLGVVGYCFRGIVIAFIAYLLFKTALFTKRTSYVGTQEAFALIEDELGVVVLLTTATGMASFGFFKLVQASYNSLDI